MEKEQKKVVSMQDALDICQRNLDKGYLSDYTDDVGFYESGYACCLKDIAYLILGDDDGYGTKKD